MKSLFTSALFWLIASSYAHATTEQQNIQQVINHYESALNAGDISSVLKLYGQSPTFMPQHALAQIGRDAVNSAYEHVFQTIKLTIKFTTHEVEVNGDTAWARTSSSGTATILANNVVVDEGNNELFIFKKEKGQWKIHQYLFSTNKPRQ